MHCAWTIHVTLTSGCVTRSCAKTENKRSLHQDAWPMRRLHLAGSTCHFVDCMHTHICSICTLTLDISGPRVCESPPNLCICIGRHRICAYGARAALSTRVCVTIHVIFTSGCVTRTCAKTENARSLHQVRMNGPCDDYIWVHARLGGGLHAYTRSNTVCVL